MATIHFITDGLKTGWSDCKKSSNLPGIDMEKVKRGAVLTIPDMTGHKTPGEDRVALVLSG
jgi:hypothetical protein